MGSSVASGTVTFLFTDIVGSSALWDRFPQLMEQAVARHDELLRVAFADSGGEVFATGGDGFAVAFQSAESAVLASVHAQGALASEVWHPDTMIRVRMGVNTGVAERRDGDYFGRAVSRAARIGAAAHGGQVLLSAATAALVADGGWSCIDAGELALRGFSRPEHVFLLEAPGLNVDDVPTGALQAGGNLPPQRSPLIGRSKESERVRALLQHGALITITGPGGVGKTRLAVSAASEASRAFSDGVWLVELGEVSDPAAVAPATATTLGLRLGAASDPCEAISQALGGQERLLILDNCEHVIDASSELIEAIRKRCPRVAIAVTSRELLGLNGEVAVPMRPLGLDTEAGVSEAAQLFCERADGVLGGFTPDAAELEVIEEICRRLDGLPLAVELAAARLPAYGVQPLLDQLSDRFDLLTRRRGAVERQRSLRTTVAWSYDLLSPGEQLVFDRLSVFPGDFDIAAANEICGFEPLDGTVVRHVASLVERSLLLNVRASDGARFQMLETLRQFGEEKLVARSESLVLQTRHMEHYAAWVAQADAGLRSREEARWHRAYEAEWHNLRQAVGTAANLGDGDAGCHIVWHCVRWAATRYRLEFGDWADQVSTMQSVADHPLRPIVLAAAAVMAHLRGDYAKCHSIIEEARDEELRLGEALEPWVPDVVGQITLSMGPAAAADASAELRRRAPDDPYWRVMADRMDALAVWLLIGSNQAGEDEIERHLARVRDAVANAEAFGCPELLAFIKGILGACLIFRDIDEALSLLEQSLDAAHHVGSEAIAFGICADLAITYSMLDRPVDALAVLGPAMRQDARSGAWMNFFVLLSAAVRPLIQLGCYRTAALSWAYIEEFLRDAAALKASLMPTGAYDALVAVYTTDELARLREEGSQLELPELADVTLLAIDEVLADT